ncbi:hypothetical protein PR048_030400 [Dryococelus australis]|uniref:Uncharacterized protein n=1 Tax=Dryococelus australis TaxID=614101 RepID=A0ABQ9GCR4_9NEOP|nr:hypothetical protein PR048_030400 [Dryococelus australis]
MPVTEVQLRVVESSSLVRLLGTAGKRFKGQGLLKQIMQDVCMSHIVPVSEAVSCVAQFRASLECLENFPLKENRSIISDEGCWMFNHTFVLYARAPKGNELKVNINEWNKTGLYALPVQFRHRLGRAAVVERLACSPPTKLNLVKSPAGPLWIFASGNRTG